MKNKYRDAMLEEIGLIEKSIIEMKKRLNTLPDGAISCFKDGDRYKWIHLYKTIDNAGNKHRERRYIPKDNDKLAFELAYKTYLEKEIKDQEKELHAMRSYIKKSPTKDSAVAYMKRNPEINRLIQPYTCKWDVNSEIWRNIPNEVNNTIPNTNPIYTKAGEAVRSKGEMIICDRLYDLGIPYKVEKPLDVSRAFQIIDDMKIPYSGKRYKFLFPDITILDKRRGEIIWEHMGLCDNASYMQHNSNKILIYSLMGYTPFKNFIFSCEDNEHYIDTIWIDTMIDYYLRH